MADEHDANPEAGAAEGPASTPFGRAFRVCEHMLAHLLILLCAFFCIGIAAIAGSGVGWVVEWATGRGEPLLGFVRFADYAMVLVAIIAALQIVVASWREFFKRCTTLSRNSR